MDDLHAELNKLSYRELQLSAKKNNIKANQKREVMINELAAKLSEVSMNDSNASVPSIELDEPPSFGEDAFRKQLNDGNKADDDSLRRLTFVKTDSAESALPDATVTVVPANESTSFVRSNSEPHLAALKSPSLNRKHGSYSRLCPDEVGPYFAKKHDELNRRSDNIKIARQKSIERQRAMTQGISQRINDLAQPKRRSQSPFLPPRNPAEMEFSFGNVSNIQAVQKPVDFTDENALPLRQNKKPHARKSIGVKGLTMRSRFGSSQSSTQTRNPSPDRDRECTSQTQTPTRSENVGTSRRVYAPKFHSYKYVDTTAMSDAEYEKFKQQQQNKP